MARRKWNGSGEMREVNEMYLRLNTLRDRFEIGPLIKNHSEGEVMRRDRVRSKDSVDSVLCLTAAPAAESHPKAFKNFFKYFFLLIIRHEKATDLQLNTHF